MTTKYLFKMGYIVMVSFLLLVGCIQIPPSDITLTPTLCPGCPTPTLEPSPTNTPTPVPLIIDQKVMIQANELNAILGNDWANVSNAVTTTAEISLTDFYDVAYSRVYPIGVKGVSTDIQDTITNSISVFKDETSAEQFFGRTRLDGEPFAFGDEARVKSERGYESFTVDVAWRYKNVCVNLHYFGMSLISEANMFQVMDKIQSRLSNTHAPAEPLPLPDFVASLNAIDRDFSQAKVTDARNKLNELDQDYPLSSEISFRIIKIWGAYRLKPAYYGQTESDDPLKDTGYFMLGLLADYVGTICQSTDGYLTFFPISDLHYQDIKIWNDAARASLKTRKCEAAPIDVPENCDDFTCLNLILPDSRNVELVTFLAEVAKSEESLRKP